MSTPSDNVEAIVDAALDLPPADRAAYLDKVCGNDALLRQKVEALLRAHQHAPTPRSRPTPVPPATIPSEKPGDKIGPYKLLQRIGEGGCGVVYMAEQEEPVRRRVALKVIKLGMDTKQVIARFEAERQALALMDHPNIAKVFEAGASEIGRPYFVMELVRGIKITDYCDQNNLPTHKRLELFIQVCKAVEHAHQKGIIHRDIKPSNILVTLHDGVPVPKVIDFGIAKAVEQRLTDKTVFTAFEQFIGTPAYMSPEQAELSGLDIDTRSDIYSLGVLLYEVLTSLIPFDAKDLAAAGLDEMRRIIREKDPARPSTKLSALTPAEQTTVAMQRQVEARKLIHLVRGDLDWIVMKCLEKDRTRRYETANGLAQDIERHLSSELVLARPPSALYRFQKRFRRNKVAFAVALALACAVLIGVFVSRWVTNFYQSLYRGDTVECLGMTLVNPTERLIKRYQLPDEYVSRGPIVLENRSLFLFQIPPHEGCAFWLVQHPAYRIGNEGFPSFAPKTVQQLVQAILSCTLTPEQYQALWSRARQEDREAADRLKDQPFERERVLRFAATKLPDEDAGKYICRVVYADTHVSTTTHIRMTKEDIDQLRDLLKKLPPP